MLVPEIVRARDAIDRTRRLPISLAGRLRSEGLFQLWLPGALGGPELHPTAFLGVIEALATADGAVAWCAANASVFSLLAGSLPGEVALEIFGEHGVIAGSINPTGRANAVSGGFRASGRWAYASGIDHATWVLDNCVIHDHGVPRRTASGAPDMRFLFFPRSAVELLDSWNVSGLRGTGSHDFVSMRSSCPRLSQSRHLPPFRMYPGNSTAFHRLASSPSPWHL